ncbi:unnamed protein product, partial [marine sediment metagenome]
QESIAKYFKCGVRTVSSRIAEIKASDNEIVKTALKLAKQKQQLSDINRIERKTFREGVRLENALVVYNEELIKVLKKYDLPNFVKEKGTKSKKSNLTGIIHLTDVHFNELVNLSINQYDFSIASKRLKKLVNKAKIYFNSFGIKDVLITMTGDLMNSDRRLDELLSQATNRSKATFLSVSILRQTFLDLASNYNLTIANVIGNESRISKEVGWAESVASDNYDYTIYNILKLLFEKSNIRFLEGDLVEQVI